MECPPPKVSSANVTRQTSSRLVAALGFNDTDSGVTAFYLAAGIAVLAVSLVTNYQYRPQTAVTTDWSGSGRRTVGAPVAAYANPWRP
jgi:hypothetical protein